LAAIVFGSKKNIELLNSITHKYVVQEIDETIKKIVQSCQNYKIVLDVPIPVKDGFLNVCDEIWVLTAKIDIRVERILKRNPNLTIEDVKKRISTQLSDEEYIKFADKIINNNSNLFDLEEVVDRYLQKKTI